LIFISIFILEEPSSKFLQLCLSEWKKTRIPGATDLPGLSGPAEEEVVA
jgi:hypothetical protein